MIFYLISISINNENFVNLRYEGFGPFNVAFIIETLTDNKNRSASSIRTVLQKNGGRLGETGSTSYLFSNCGIIHIDKNLIKEYINLQTVIRNAGISTEIYPGEGKLKKQMEYANKIKSPAVILYGENEIKSGKPTLRNLSSGEEKSIEIKELVNEIKKII